MCVLMSVSVCILSYSHFLSWLNQNASTHQIKKNKKILDFITQLSFAICGVQYFLSATRSVQASRAQRMMGMHKKMVNAVPTSPCSALMRPKKQEKQTTPFSTRPIIWSCHLSVTASRQFVTTITYHYIPNSWSSIVRWVCNIQWSILKRIVLCMYAVKKKV